MLFRGATVARTGLTVLTAVASWAVGTGPALWKKTWGFEGVPLDYHIRAAPGHEPRDINPLSPQYRRKIALWRALPNGVADRLGPWIARGLG